MADCATGILIDFNDEKKTPQTSEMEEFRLPPLMFDEPEVAMTSPESYMVANLKPKPETVEDLLNKDVKFIDTEEFNFDLLLSPTSDARYEEEEVDGEVFFGSSVGFSEICAAASIACREESISEMKPMSPLNPQQVAELFKEAHTLAYHLENTRTDSPDTVALDNLARQLRLTKIAPTKLDKLQTKLLSQVKSPSGDSGLADTSCSSQEADKADDIPGTESDSTASLVKIGAQTVNHIRLHKSDLTKSQTLAAKSTSTKFGLQGLKISKISKTGLRVPAPKPTSVQKPGPSLVRGGSMRVRRTVTSPVKRQRKDSLGSDVETFSVTSHHSDTSSVALQVPHKQSSLPPKPQTISKMAGLRLPRLPQSRTRTLSNSSSCSNASTSSQVSSCSQTSVATLSSLAPKSKLQLKPESGLRKPLQRSASERKPGPMKAKPMSPPPVSTVPEKENVPSSMQPPETRAPRRPASTNSSQGSVGSTPTPKKVDKNLQPKRLLSSATPGTPAKSVMTGPPTTPLSSVSSSLKRKSFLPTPSSASRSVQPSPLLPITNQNKPDLSGSDGSPVFMPRRPSHSLHKHTTLNTPDVTKKLFQQ